MGNYSRDSYKINMNKNYVNVRLQQGVPLVDADWNEMDDIRKYELQDFLNRFIGSGVPDNNGFLIREKSQDLSDFIISPGYCLVNGRLVINEDGIRYSDQQLPNGEKLPPLEGPKDKTRIDTVYLDVWEREVNSDEDKDIKLKYAGNELETCVRIKREWVVRVAVGDEGSGEAAPLPIASDGHLFYKLATLHHSKEVLKLSGIIDERFVGLNLEKIARSVDLSRIHKVPLLEKALYGRIKPPLPIPVGNNPSGVAFDGTYIWVTNKGSNNLSKIDIDSNVVTSVDIGSGTIDVAFDGKRIWVTNNASNGVNAIDLDTGYVSYDETGPNPVGIAFDGMNMWVANNGSNTVTKIDLRAGKKTDIVVGSAPYGVAFDGEHIWVANSGSDNVSKISLTSDAVVESIRVGPNPAGIAFDGEHIWVTNNGGQTASKVNITWNLVEASVRVGKEPLGVAFDGTHIWVANNGGQTVSKIDITKNKELARINVGSNPSGIAFDGTDIWVALNGNNAVCKIKKII